MNSHKAWSSYRQVATQTASAGQLILMLFDGAIRFLEHARTGFAKDDPAECNETINNNILRAQEILQELNLSLNVQEGGDLAVHLRKLYDYMDWRLQESNRKKDEEGIIDVLKRMVVLRDAWATMLQSQCAGATAVGSQGHYAAV